MTIASKLTDISNIIVSKEETKENIRQAIEAKGVTVENTVLLSSYPEKISEIQTGSSTIANGVKATYIDYDGTILKEEYGPVGFTPTPPADPAGDDVRIFLQWIGDKENLTEDTVIGANYWFGSNLKSYLFIKLDTSTGLTVTFNCFMVASTFPIIVAWGDGNSSTLSAGLSGNQSITHTYSSIGYYRILVDGVYQTNGQYLGGNNSSLPVINLHTALYKAYIGWQANLGDYTFYQMYGLTTVCLSGIGSNPDQYNDLGGFQECYGLKALVVPGGFRLNYSTAFIKCSGLKYFIMPRGGISTYSVAPYFFQYCYSLEYVKLPSASYGLTQLGTGFFSECRSLKHVIIPSTVTYVGSESFRECTSLKKMTIPETVTDLSSFSIFYNCYSLEYLDVGANTSSIGTNLIAYCWNLRTLIIRKTVPPTISSTIGIAARDRLSPLLKIYVPDAAVDTYKTTSGWSLYADMIYPLSEYSS